MLALMLGLEHFAPRVPAPLVTVAVGIALSAFAGLDKAGISLVGTVQAGLPTFALPDLSLVEQLWPAALGIALMSFVETAAAGRAFVRKGDPLPEANQRTGGDRVRQTSSAASSTSCRAGGEHRRRP